MQFHISPGDALPIYRQIVQQIVDAIAGQTLTSGARLPSHRELAQQLVIAPMTVKKAYDELERSGYIKMVRGQGTFVNSSTPAISGEEKLERLVPLVKRLVNEASLLGIRDAQLRELLSSEIKQLGQTRSSHAGPHKKSSP